MVLVGVRGYLAVGKALKEDLIVALVVAVALAGLVGAIPVLGGIIGFVLSSIGVGATYLQYRDENKSSGRRRSSSSTRSPPR